MTDQCGNCGEEIRLHGAFKKGNLRYHPDKIQLVNISGQSAYVDLCESCGTEIVQSTVSSVAQERDGHWNFVQNNITHFPMFTAISIPNDAQVKIIGLITANVTVGTGLFNEWSQGFSDMFGVVNVDSGMAHKVNQGEGAARAILAKKARSMGGNCVLGIDIDYGQTTNNAATVNMQGTAAYISNLQDIMTAAAFAQAENLEASFARGQELGVLLSGRE